MNVHHSTERTRLQLDGVGPAITAERAWATGDTTLVRQALPFLRLDTHVTDEDGRRARITSVTISMDGDVPRLELELRELDEVDAPPSAAADDTLVGFTLGVSERPARTDSTVPYAYDADRPSQQVIVRDPSPEPSLEPAARVAGGPAAQIVRAARRSRPAGPSFLARLLGSFVRAWRLLVRRPAFALLRG